MNTLIRERNCILFLDNLGIIESILISAVKKYNGLVISYQHGYENININLINISITIVTKSKNITTLLMIA